MHDETAHTLKPGPDDPVLVGAAAALRDGALVAFPTETVYGLGADARNGLAVARIFETKGRPSFNPLIVHVMDREMAGQYVTMTREAMVLADTFWPGPLTLVLPAREGNGTSSLVSAGLDTLAVRVPAHPVAQALLRAADCPIAAPSANRSGRISPTRAEHVRAEFGDTVPIILDGGASDVGLESTIVDLSGSEPFLLRPGGISKEALEAALGEELVAPERLVSEIPTAPGQLASHYAPAASVRLNAGAVDVGEGLLGFGSKLPDTSGPVVNLSAHGDLREAAANLFDGLRMLDAAGVSCIAVMPIPLAGIGVAINDRLQRAAAPRN